MSLNKFFKSRLAKNEPVSLELVTLSGNLEKAEVLSIDPTNSMVSLKRRGHALPMDIRCSNIITDRVAGLAIPLCWAMNQSTLDAYQKWLDVKVSIDPYVVFKDTMATLPGCELCKVTVWPGKDVNGIAAFLDVAHSNHNVTAAGFILLTNGKVLPFEVAPAEAHFQILPE